MTALGHEPSFGQAAQFLLSPRADTRCAGLHHPLHRRMLAVFTFTFERPA
jgi:hypothetical protein